MAKTFHLFPAIDLRAGQVVRLMKGDPGKKTHYSSDPVGTAKRWIASGAAWLHVVNLDGAFGETTQRNLSALAGIARTAQPHGVRIQFGGGLRELDQVSAVLEMGVDRAILGTAVIENPDLLKLAIRNWGQERIAVSLDAREEEAYTHGWQKAAKKNMYELAAEYETLGVKWLIYTDISRDGMQTGYNHQRTLRLAKETRLHVIASGGVRAVEDIALARKHGLAGIILGKALYENKINLEEAIHAHQKT